MTVHVQIHRSCDRCEKPFDIKQQGPKDPLPEFVPESMVCTLTKVDVPSVLFRFEDLCPDCHGVVMNLIERIKLEKDEKPKDEKKQEARSGTEKPTPEKPPKKDEQPTGAKTETKKPEQRDTQPTKQGTTTSNLPF